MASKSEDSNNITAPDGGFFVHRSPLSSQPHDPPLCLASNCVRDYFGPLVQTVFDAMIRVGGTATLLQLLSTIRKEYARRMNSERVKIVVRGKLKLERARGSANHGYVVDVGTIRAGLLVLLQHDIVTSINTEKRPQYTVVPHKARLMTRYPKWIEYVKKVMDDTAATLVETLLLEGKVSTVDVIFKTVGNLSEENKSDRYTQRQTVVETFHRLVEGNFVVKVPSMLSKEQIGEMEMNETMEYEFGEGDNEDIDMDAQILTSMKQSSTPKKKKKKKRKVSFMGVDIPTVSEDPAIVSILSNAPYKTSLPRNEIWRLNWALIQSSLKSFCLGRLVAERYGHRVTSAGSIVTAALKYQSYSTNTGPDAGVFTPNDLANFLPKAVVHTLEKKAGGMKNNLSRSLVELSTFDYPTVVDEVEEAHGHPSGGKFSICTTKLVKHLRDRTIHQFLFHAYGDLAARIVSVLRVQGGCEAEHLAESAMVPAKDTREILHRMYVNNLVELITLQQGKAHNPSTMIYIWTVNHTHLLRVVKDEVCRAMTNMRLRRQHEAEIVGKAWMQRALQEDVDENESEEDKAKYNKFCQGLERLDYSMMHLDETLMVLYDF